MYWVRPLHDADRDPYAQLLRDSPDTGRVQFARHFTRDPLTALHALHRDATVAVAEHAAGELVGTGTVSFGALHLHDQPWPSAYLSALAVHPAHRRRGVAKALAAWLVQAAHTRFGDDGVVYALIQRGNEGSLRATRVWQPALTGRITAAPVPVRPRPTPPTQGGRVRPAEPGDWEEIAGKLSAFNGAFALAPRFTAAELDKWHAQTLAEQPWRHYLVASDAAGNILAGIGMAEVPRLSVLKVASMPPTLRLLNAAVHVVPRDGTLRLMQVEKVFFLPGREEAGRHLFQSARYLWRERGSHLSVQFDPRGPLTRMYALPWWLPTTELHIALRAPLALPDNALVHPEG